MGRQSGEHRRFAFPPQVWCQLVAIAKERSMSPERLAVELVELKLIEMRQSRSRDVPQCRGQSSAATLMSDG